MIIIDKSLMGFFLVEREREFFSVVKLRTVGRGGGGREFSSAVVRH